MYIRKHSLFIILFALNIMFGPYHTYGHAGYPPASRWGKFLLKNKHLKIKINILPWHESWPKHQKTNYRTFFSESKKNLNNLNCYRKKIDQINRNQSFTRKCEWNFVSYSSNTFSSLHLSGLEKILILGMTTLKQIPQKESNCMRTYGTFVSVSIYFSLIYGL